jgi:hypothetical protein
MTYQRDPLAGELIMRDALVVANRGGPDSGRISCGKSTLFDMELRQFWRAPRSFHAPMALTIWRGASIAVKANSGD